MEAKQRKLVGLIVGLVILFGAIGWLVVWAVQGAKETRQRQSAEAKPESIQATATTWTVQKRQNETETMSGYNVTYAFHAGDRVVSKEMKEWEDYKPDATYKVCYNPKDPMDAALYPASHVCGSTDY
jgi:flagellar basal body-associated protein FliL